MKPLPMPVRIAAGLVAIAVEQARDLPRLVVEFPVTAVSQALQTSMRVQQKVTELAIKGDRALDSLRPVSDAPSWATFDDEDPVTEGTSTVTEIRPGADARFDDDPEDDDPEPEGPAHRSNGSAAHDAAGPAAATTTTTDDVPETSDDDLGGPDVLPGYSRLTIPQLRGKLRQLGADELRTLLQWEITHGNRPPYVTMLGNRIVTVGEE